MESIPLKYPDNYNFNISMTATSQQHTCNQMFEGSHSVYDNGGKHVKTIVKGKTNKEPPTQDAGSIFQHTVCRDKNCSLINSCCVPLRIETFLGGVGKLHEESWLQRSYVPDGMMLPIPCVFMWIMPCTSTPRAHTVHTMQPYSDYL